VGPPLLPLGCPQANFPPRFSRRAAGTFSSPDRGRGASGFDPVFEGLGTYGCTADFGFGLACGVGEGDCCGADAGLTGAAGGMVMRGKPTTSFDGGLAGAGGALGLGEFGGVAVSAIGFRPSPVRQ